MTLVISATFYQNTGGESLFNLNVIEQKAFAGVVSSLVVFLPIALIDFLMGRVFRPHLVRPRKDSSNVSLELTNINAAKGELHDGTEQQLFRDKTWTMFFLPFWVEYILYAILFIGSMVSGIVAILYGIQFTGDISTNWIEAFFIGWAVSVFILEPIQAILGSILATIIGAVSAFAAGLVLILTNTFST